MKRRYANKVKGEYSQKRIDEEFFKGYVAFVKIKDVQNPLVVNDGEKDVCIKDNDYKWIEVYPDNEHYAVTIMFDNNDNLIEWYFDIAKEIGIENNIPYEDDLYVDIVITPNGRKEILDEEELMDALNNNEITQKDVELVYETVKLIEDKFVNNFSYLTDLTDKFLKMFDIN